MRTGVVASVEAHPVRRYFERGLFITISTDDPKMFGNSLAEEYRLLENRFGFSRQEIRTLILQGIRAAWLSAEKKQELVEEFVHTPVWRAGMDETIFPSM
jgi:adenosine deaminase